MSESGPSSSTLQARSERRGERSDEGGSPAASDDPLSRRRSEPPDPEVPDRRPRPQPDPALSVTFVLDTADTDPPLAGWIEAELARLADLAGVTGGDLTLVAVDDARMAELHGEYRGDPTTTDVLTFDLRDAPADTEAPVDGDVVICLDEACRQAEARGHDIRLEALLYALHGLLHLLGEDDTDEPSARRMHQREDELLRTAGFGAVYARPGRSPDHA